MDAGEGSCDAVLELPDELRMQLGWDEDDMLELSVQNDQGLIIRKM